MLYSEAEALHDRQQQIVTLFAHCCSMHMTVENHHEPFRPYIVMANRGPMRQTMWRGGREQNYGVMNKYIL